MTTRDDALSMWPPRTHNARSRGVAPTPIGSYGAAIFGLRTGLSTLPYCLASSETA